MSEEDLIVQLRREFMTRARNDWHILADLAHQIYYYDMDDSGEDLNSMVTALEAIGNWTDERSKAAESEQENGR